MAAATGEIAAFITLGAPSCTFLQSLTSPELSQLHPIPGTALPWSIPFSSHLAEAIVRYAYSCPESLQAEGVLAMNQGTIPVGIADYSGISERLCHPLRNLSDFPHLSLEA